MQFLFFKHALEHLSLGVGSKALAKKYNVKSARQIRQWIHNYNEFGEEGLKRSRQKNNYSFEFKLHMVESYLSNEVSYEELALANGITNYTMISRWVEAFRVAGPDGLRPRKKGRKKLWIILFATKFLRMLKRILLIQVLNM